MKKILFIELFFSLFLILSVIGCGSDGDSSSVGVQGGPTAKCVDGTYSFSAHSKGTCSGHGGVSEWLNPPND
jgi:hypothetical protein